MVFSCCHEFTDWLYLDVICRDYAIGKKICLKPLHFRIVLYKVPQNNIFIFFLKAINTGQET
jgi:hypothetical protein